MSNKDLMLQVIHQAIGLTGKEPIPLNVCSVLSPDCDGFDLNTVAPKLFLLPKVKCFTVAESKESVRTAQEFVYVPDYTFDDHPDIDILIIGAGQLGLKSVQSWLTKTVPQVHKYVVGICGGAALLAEAGVLDGKRATVSKFMFSMLTQIAPKVHWNNTVNYVQDGKFLTASGACAGLDAAFHLVQLLYGREVALKLSFINEHRWLEDPTSDPLADLYDNGMLKADAIDIHDAKRKKS